MNLLLDTHILIWALTEDERLPEKARQFILDPDNAIYYSTASIWEISIKHAIHPDEIEFSGRELSTYCQEAGFLQLEIRGRHVYALETLVRPKDAPPHKDPFDRILLSQAKAENMSFLTHDALISGYDEKCVIPV